LSEKRVNSGFIRSLSINMGSFVGFTKQSRIGVNSMSCQMRPLPDIDPEPDVCSRLPACSRKLLVTIRNHTIIFILVTGISACNSVPRAPSIKMDDLPPEQLNAVRAVKLYNQAKITRQKFAILKGIEGVSCKNSFWGRAATKRDAILQAQYVAQQAGADGIINLQCEVPRNPSAKYDCSKVVICTGDAIKFVAGETRDPPVPVQ